jgi:transposase
MASPGGFYVGGMKVHLALGHTDMRKGIDGLAMLVQAILHQDPFSGHLFVFRGRKANLIKIVYWDGTGLCLFTKRLEQGVFLWPPDVDPGETLALSSEQLSMLIDGVDWRAPERRWRPAVAG